MDYKIRVWWRNTKQYADYTYASSQLAKEHFRGFKTQQSVTNVVLYDTNGRIIAIDGILSGRVQ